MRPCFKQNEVGREYNYKSTELRETRQSNRASQTQVPGLGRIQCMSVRPTTLITPGKPFSGKLPPHTLEAKVYNIHQLHRGLLVLASQPLSIIPPSYPSPMSNALASPKPSWIHLILTIPVWTYWSEKKVQRSSRGRLTSTDGHAFNPRQAGRSL